MNDDENFFDCQDVNETKDVDKIDSEKFYAEWSGHTNEHLMTVKKNFDLNGNQEGFIYLAGDSSLDNKAWFDDTADAVNGYEHFLEPPKSKCDIAWNMNKLLAEKGIKYVCINTSVEATTLEQRETLLHHDEFIRDNITENDYLIVCIGGNDIALQPSPKTQLHMGQIVQMPDAESIRNNKSEWGVDHFKTIFKTNMENYLHKLCKKKKPKKILLCMIYFPDEANEPSWAGGALQMLGYDTKPEILQTAIQVMFEEGISKVEFPSEVIPYPLYSVLDGKTTSDYEQRVEPSPSGGAKMANGFLQQLFGEN